MCTSLFLLDAHPALLLLLLFNRDEFYNRPTHPMHYWPDHPDILAGRDAMRGGTWLGVTKTGRWAFLTNFREPQPQQHLQQQQQSPGDGTGAAAAGNATTTNTTFPQTTSAPSRGALTTDFLAGSQAPLEYLEALPRDRYMGVSVAVGDLSTGEAAFFSNRGNGNGNGGSDGSSSSSSSSDGARPIRLPPGAHGISNGALGAWPKVTGGLRALERVLAGADVARDGVPWDKLWGPELMGDASRAPPGQVPLTGVGEALDEALSARFVRPFEVAPGARYGTRSQTAVAVWRDGRVEARERFYVGPAAAAAAAGPVPRPMAAAAAAAGIVDCDGDDDDGDGSGVADGEDTDGLAPLQQQQQPASKEGLRAMLEQSSVSLGAAAAAPPPTRRNGGGSCKGANGGSAKGGSPTPTSTTTTTTSTASKSRSSSAAPATCAAAPPPSLLQPPQPPVCPNPVGVDARPSPGPGNDADEWRMVAHEFVLPALAR